MKRFSYLVNLCCVCFTPIERVEHLLAVSRTLLDGALYEGMYLIHRACQPRWRAVMDEFEASLPSPNDVEGILS